jgi:hypothetical protein
MSGDKRVVVARSTRPGFWEKTHNETISWERAAYNYNTGLGTLVQRKVDKTPGFEKYQLEYQHFKNVQKPPVTKMFAR